MFNPERMPAEKRYYRTIYSLVKDNPEELALIGASLGGGFVNTAELKPMKFNEAMETPDKDKWYDAVDDEHQRFVDQDVFETIAREDVPSGAKIMSSTWAMKKKSNGTFRARLNARGYEQVEGKHYDEHDRSAPVVSAITIHIVLVLILMMGWYAVVMDVKGAFLYGEFDEAHKVYMEVPQGWERFYPSNVILMLLKTVYGCRQSAKAFWKKLLQALKRMGFKRSKADSCLYFRKTDKGLVLIISWIDDLLIAGPKELVLETKELMKEYFECDDIGELTDSGPSVPLGEYTHRRQ